MLIKKFTTIYIYFRHLNHFVISVESRRFPQFLDETYLEILFWKYCTWIVRVLHNYLLMLMT